VQFAEGEELQVLKDSDLSGNMEWWRLRAKDGREGLCSLSLSLSFFVFVPLIIISTAMSSLAGFGPSSYFEDDDDDDDDGATRKLQKL
jgi:hypothetical protein